jgi:serine/threonine-protein kinase
VFASRTLLAARPDVQSVRSEDPAFDVRQSEARARVGTTIDGKWHLDRLIAVGGWGAVYEGTHRNGMRGAVKVLDPSLTVSMAARKRFLREGELTNHVHHDGVVRVLDDDVADDGTLYLVMELLAGSTLDELAARSGGKLEPHKAIEYGIQVLDTLARAHAEGIVHRDVKPENIFLTNDGIVKLLDFGIAAVVCADGSARLTHAGDAVGTPAFMAPEQARGRCDLVDERSDLFSLGASLFTLLTGKVVNEAETVAQMLVLTMSRKSPSLRDLLPDAPDALVRAIDGALELDKSKRWPNAAAMRAVLEEAYLALTGNVASRPAPLPLDVTPEPAPERVERLAKTRAERRLPNLRWLSLAFAGIVGAVLVATLAHGQHTVAPMPALVTSGIRAETKTATTNTSTASPHSQTDKPRRYDPIYDRRY